MSQAYDIAVIGSGPAGYNAAITAGQQGASVLLIEREPKPGGACVQYGTIPSKTLRETAVTLSAFRRRSGGVYDIQGQDDLQLRSLMIRLQQVVNAHQATTQRLLRGAGVVSMHGRARFTSGTELEILSRSGETTNASANKFIIATGSRPRTPPNIDVDHENILDSDSLLSMTYLPKSLLVWGSGVIACEYAATFSCLGVRVTMVDKYPSPLGFLDRELVDVFLRQFESSGGQFVGESELVGMEWDGIASVHTILKEGTTFQTDKAFVAQGRLANVDNLGLEQTDVKLTNRGLVEVDANYQTGVESVYAIGDAIGPPALASTALEQGRAAALHAIGSQSDSGSLSPPTGIYTIPEIACVGMSEEQAKEKHGSVLIGTCRLEDLARGQITATTGGLLKLVAERQSGRIVGVHIVGDGATELIHVGQLVVETQRTVRELASTVFSFPTLTEAYRQAAFSILSQQMRDCQAAPQLVVTG